VKPQSRKIPKNTMEECAQKTTEKKNPEFFVDPEVKTTQNGFRLAQKRATKATEF
tara:strand:- start:223 stop:387 length:165 start_codon:yes stop_codon:yes gene_type:complete